MTVHDLTPDAWVSDLPLYVPTATDTIQFQNSVIELAEFHGWLTAFVKQPLRTRASFPNLLLARQGKVIVAEMIPMSRYHDETGIAMLEHHDDALLWKTQFAGNASIATHVWTPADWDAIKEALR